MSQVTDKTALLNLSITKQKEIIRHEFTAEELNDIRNSIADNLMKVNDLEEELQEIKDDFKGKINPLKKENKHLLKDNKNKFRDQEIEVYLVPDYDSKIMEFFNEEGIKVGDRKMMMSEMQGRLNLK